MPILLSGKDGVVPRGGKLSFYEEIADYYDFIFPLNRTQIDFVKDCVKEPYQKKLILDIGCGTGDLAIALSEEEFSVTAIDSDAEMISKANKKIKNEENVKFSCMDMRNIKNFFAKHTFDSVMCFGNTLVHLTTLSEIEDFCRQARYVLKDNSKFLIQILNYSYIIDNNITELPLIENNNITFKRYYEYDKLIAFKTILKIKKSGKTIENVVYLYPLRKQELGIILHNAGFNDVSYYGDFDKRALEEKSLPLLVEAL